MRVVQGDKPKGLAYPLAEVKNYLRVDSSHEDQLVATLISAAVDYIRTETWIDLQSISLTAYLDDWCEVVELERSPVTEITSVKYYDTDGTLQTLSTSDYSISTNGAYARIYFDNTPNLRDKEFDNIEIAFKSGYANHYDIPEALVQALLSIVYFNYENRNVMMRDIGTIPAAAKIILNNYSNHR